MQMVKRKILGILLMGCALLSWSAGAQQSQILPWQLTEGDPNEPLVYHPEPILFVHGINDNDSDWVHTIPALTNAFAIYDVTRSMDGFIHTQTNHLNAVQQPYLHTFNYGNSVNPNLPDNAQSFDHIEWNAWAADMRTKPFTNMFLRSVSTNITIQKWVSDTSKTGGHNTTITTNLPHDLDYLHSPANDQRMTLDVRINDPDKGIRAAYIANANDPTNIPNIVLVAHSMGGLLAHYYLCKCVETSTNSGVRRLVTLATPHCGSPVANDEYKFFVIDPVDRLTHGANITMLYKLGRTLTGGRKDPVGFAEYPAAGAVEELRVSDPAQPNALQTYFTTHNAPAMEYVFNGYKLPMLTLYRAYSLFGDANAWCDVKNGDGIVSLASAAGKTNHISPSVWKGQDPVIFEPWLSQDHSDANKHPPSLFASLFGVPYQWPATNPPVPSPAQLVQPVYAQTYGENQAFSKQHLAMTDIKVNQGLNDTLFNIPTQ